MVALIYSTTAAEQPSLTAEMPEKAAKAHVYCADRLEAGKEACPLPWQFKAGKFEIWQALKIIAVDLGGKNQAAARGHKAIAERALLPSGGHLDVSGPGRVRFGRTCGGFADVRRGRADER